MLTRLYVLGATVVLIGGCGGAAQPAAVASPSPSSSPSATATADPNTIGVANNPRHGQILVDGAGMTLYLFTADTGTASTCDANCAGAWPPLLTSSPKAGPGAQASLLGTTTRSDGKVQATYAGHPLYHLFTDTAPGKTNGQGANAFGGLWWVVAPSGTAIH
jgi:predicted lipoprotein with Yx(FWY)xxD motif